MTTCPFRSWGRRSDRSCEPGCHFHDGSGCTVVSADERGKFCPLDDEGMCSQSMCAYGRDCAIGGKNTRKD